MSMLKMCLNWKVVAGLAALGLAIWVVAPGLVAAALPLLLLAACPLSMLLMGASMARGHGTAAAGQTQATAASEAASLRAELEGLRAREAALAARIGALEGAAASSPASPNEPRAAETIAPAGPSPQRGR